MPKLKRFVEQVFIVEGEKCADAVQNLYDEANISGVCATTFPNGTATTKEVKKIANLLADKNLIVICQDNDKPGRKSGSLIQRELIKAGINPKKIDLIDFSTKFDGSEAPTGYDVADLIDEIREEYKTGLSAVSWFVEYLVRNRI